MSGGCGMRSPSDTATCTEHINGSHAGEDAGGCRATWPIAGWVPPPPDPNEAERLLLTLVTNQGKNALDRRSYAVAHSTARRYLVARGLLKDGD